MAQIVRRITSTPQQRGSLTGQSCPDMFELDDGTIAIIGTFETLPDGRRALVIPRELMIDAVPYINEMEGGA